MLRCSKCQKDCIDETKYINWLSLINYVEFLYNEEQITEKTYRKMSDILMVFKEFAFEHQEREESV